MKTTLQSHSRINHLFARQRGCTWNHAKRQANVSQISEWLCKKLLRCTPESRRAWRASIGLPAKQHFLPHRRDNSLPTLEKSIDNRISVSGSRCFS
jgi:hypothetical protein